ncbi:MAG: EF2563 family selenium-dependent molybdenum hydroxylase system protein [Firmicutes bacterium]|nr:EF2563 family selenium-dependent molybdenum hydroxylase system protein [Bacillota bacterium]
MDTVLIRGAGDLASGTAAQLHRAGWRIVMTELPQPLSVRCAVSFSRAVYQERCRVEEIAACRVDSPARWRELPREIIAVTVADYREVLAAVRPRLVVDGTMAKCNLGLSLSDAPLVVALGPGFHAGRDCHAVIETQRGPRLGQAIFDGPAAADTGVPGLIGGAATERVLRTPQAGLFRRCSDIGDTVAAGQTLARVGELPVRAAIGGVLRGLLPDGTAVTAAMKCGDVDPRGRRELCFTISDKALAVGAGVLAALDHLLC